jgi:glycosyltransferase involved in cell wall biosynthesis
MKAFRVPRVFHLHGKGARQAAEKSGVLRFLYKWCFDGAYVIHLSSALYPDVEAWVARERLFSVPNGFAGPVRAPSREGRESQPPTIGFLSNMLAAKGPLVLLSALSLLQQRGLTFRAEFAGPWREPETKEAFEAFVEKQGLSSVVTHLGPVRGAEKDAFLGRVDILAFPTLADTFPVVSIEAMAFGLPVVASEEGALSEIVQRERTGYLVPKGDAVALADALQQLISDPVLRLRMGKAGRDRYEHFYTLDHFENGLASALGAIIESARSARGLQVRTSELELAHGSSPRPTNPS